MTDGPRARHWRYISSFHGPWLQLPPEILESLANANYNTPRPRPIDPAVFFDLVKIRRLVDEATNLAVRAATGVASINQHHNTSSAHHHAASLGLGFGFGPGGQTKLSRERKHRMREQATQKLSKAYHLDEIATSVATMQGASPLEEVASLVLQRSAQDPDAKYVHFFHEKIPSRQLAESTSLTVLDEIVAARPTEGEPLRTRATVRVFKEDFQAAALDLTEALKVYRLTHAPHRAPKLSSQELEVYENSERGRRPEDIILKEDDQPSSLEIQLLFQRAGVYLTLASQHVEAAFADQLSPVDEEMEDPASTSGRADDDGNSEAKPDLEPEETPAQTEAQKQAVEARKLVRLNAKRALRDYMAYLSHFEYSPDLPLEVAEEFARKVNFTTNGIRTPRPHPYSGKPGSPVSDGPGSAAPQRIFALSELFAATPPPDLPPYPSTELVVVRQQQSPPPSLCQTTTETLTYHPLLTDALHAVLLCHCLIQTSAKELLRHAYMVARLARLADGYPVFQASRSPARSDWMEVLRAGNNWIQLAGTWENLCAPAPLPLFQSSGSGGNPMPSSMSQTLPPSKQAKALPAPGQVLTGADADIARGLARLEAASRSLGSDKQRVERLDPGLSEKQRKERIHHQAVLDALSDDRVGDEVAFEKAIKARKIRAENDHQLDIAVAALETKAKMIAGTDTPATPESPNGAETGSKALTVASANGTNGAKSSPAPRRWAADDKDYPIATDRAMAVARWVIDAPPNAGSSGGTDGASRKRKKKPVKKTAGSGTQGVSSGSALTESKGRDAEGGIPA